jgi:hypothetical protein
MLTVADPIPPELGETEVIDFLRLKKVHEITYPEAALDRPPAFQTGSDVSPSPSGLIR